jgi:hypothetical protein
VPTNADRNAEIEPEKSIDRKTSPDNNNLSDNTKLAEPPIVTEVGKAPENSKTALLETITLSSNITECSAFNESFNVNVSPPSLDFFGISVTPNSDDERKLTDS